MEKEGVCPNCGHCKHCGHTPEAVKPAPAAVPHAPYYFDGSWICVCGQRVYSHQVHVCPQRIGPTWTTATNVKMYLGAS